MRILEYPKDQKMLRTPGRFLTKEDLESPDFKRNLDEMFEILKQEKNGIGLAATQIGWTAQVFILNRDEFFQCLEKEHVFINPKILKNSKPTVKDVEGCLSFKNLELKISRPDEIQWEYYDLDFKLHGMTSRGYYARAIMHETDHLQGKLFVDQASSTERLKFEKWLKTR